MMPTDNDGGYKVYPARWTILIGYSISSLLNAYLWISFASIDDATAAFYHVDTDKARTYMAWSLVPLIFVPLLKSSSAHACSVC